MSEGNEEKKETLDDYYKEWSFKGKPFAEILDKIKLKKPAQRKMSIVEFIFATALSKGIKAAQDAGYKDPEAMAAYITGYLGAIGMMPSEKKAS